jgi:N utilization substance protein B
MQDNYFLDDQDNIKGDKRHQRRVKLMQLLFAHTFSDLDLDFADLEMIGDEDRQLLEEMKAAVPAIDEEIALHAPERPLTEINKVDLAVMRLISFEAKHKNTPKKVLIDEAVELAKEFGTDSSPKFVNGVLAKILFKDEQVDDQSTEEFSQDKEETITAQNDEGVDKE